uniref:Uncharacterized protein n=1 Tax=Rhizophora mucronata TaxID=61149 RepID=A0A2P2R172_RHIMU
MQRDFGVFHCELGHVWLCGFVYFAKGLVGMIFVGI